MKKRKPFISIVISSNNQLNYLKRCIDSFLGIKNSEIILINNANEDKNLLESIEKLVNKYKNDNIVFFQSKYLLSKNKARNLGIDFASGSWIYFVDDFDYASKNFIKFFNTFKFNYNNHFYRVPIYSQAKQKEKIGLLKSKYYSSSASSFIINEEWIKKIGLKWEAKLLIGDSLPFINKMYDFKNVNYVYLKNIKTIYHNFSYEKDLVKYDNEFQNLKKTFNMLNNDKGWNYKQFSILLLYGFYKHLSKEQKIKLCAVARKWLFDKKIFIFSWWFLGIKLWIKTTIFRYRILFSFQRKA